MNSSDLVGLNAGQSHSNGLQMASMQARAVVSLNNSMDIQEHHHACPLVFFTGQTGNHS